MALMDRAVLELVVDGTIGHFHFMGAEVTEELDRQMLMGDRGQSVQEAIGALTGSSGAQDGFSIDAGQNEDRITLSFEGGYDADEYDEVPVQWGDGSSGTGMWDATGAHPVTMAQVLKWWAKRARTDSFRSQAKLHWGEWTDGSIGGDVGIFGRPLTVTVESVRLEREDQTPASSFEGTVELSVTSSMTELNGADENNPENIPDY